MTVFDHLNFNQRALVIQEMQVLVERLKECNMKDQLKADDAGALIIGGPTLEEIEDKILHFAENYFGMPYSHEARE